MSINPRVDLAFKRIFGVEENTDLTINLINSVVSENDQVKEIELINPYNLQNFVSDKLSILDIKAKDANNRRFNIEIQISDEADYDKRALYYWAKVYTEQLKAKEDYGLLNKAIGIHILNFTSIPQVEKYHNTFVIQEKDSHVPYFTDLELHTIELNKFEKHLPQELAALVPQLHTALDLWAAFLTRHHLLNANSLPQAINSPVLNKALTTLQTLSFTQEEREAYDNRLKWLRIETNALKKKFREGERKGIAKGKKEGLVEGEKKGLEKGKQEGEKQKAIQIAKSMLAKNYTADEIAEITGLSIEEIKQLSFD